VVRPYKDPLLDALDVVLLCILSCLAFSSLIFQLPQPTQSQPDDSVLFVLWEYVIYATAAISILVSLIAVAYELHLKVVKTRLEVLFCKAPDGSLRSRMTGRVMSIVMPSGVQLDSELAQCSKVVAARGNVLCKTSILPLFTVSALHRLFKNIDALEFDKVSSLNERLAPYVCENGAKSYLSNTAVARFFRMISESFPQLLDVLCHADAEYLPQIQELRSALKFLCRCMVQMDEYPKHLHTSIMEWQLGPVLHFLVFEARDSERADLGRLFRLVRLNYRPISLRRSLTERLRSPRRAPTEPNWKVVLGQLREQGALVPAAESARHIPPHATAEVQCSRFDLELEPRPRNAETEQTDSQDLSKGRNGRSSVMAARRTAHTVFTLADIELQMLHEAIVQSVTATQCTPLRGLQSQCAERIATPSTECQHEGSANKRHPTRTHNATSDSAFCFSLDECKCDAEAHAAMNGQPPDSEMSLHEFEERELVQHCRRLRTALKNHELLIQLTADVQHKAGLIRDYNRLFGKYQKCKQQAMSATVP
jgi:hypothetical protein